MHAGSSPEHQQIPPSVSPGHSTSLPVLQPLPSTFSRSPASVPSASASAADSAPRDWLRQFGALGSLSLKGSDVPPQARELYQVDLQASSSSPLSPQMQQMQGSAAPAGMPRADSCLARAVSARPFSIQQSIEIHKAAHPQENALPWLEVSEAGAAPTAKADAVKGQASPQGQETKAEQLQVSGTQPLANPFAGQGQPSSAQAWTFRAPGQEGMSLLDM